MNQILQTENKKSGPVAIHKVVIFFAIAIIILGIVLIGGGSYAMITGTKEEDKPQVESAVPEVNIQRTEENILMTITHTKPITSVTYHWNNDAEQAIETNNELVVSEEIALPFGNNTLNLTITDQDGNESKYVKEYVLEGNGKPIIELLLTKENKIRIKVQDTQGLKYIRYTWNNGNYTTVEANIDNLKLIDEAVDIPLGQNTLKVEAVNVNDMLVSKDLEVRGVRRPKVVLRQEGNSLIIRAEDEVAMKVVNFTLNGKKYQINFGEIKVIEHRIDLPQGEYTIQLSAENTEGGITEVNGKGNVE